jgi:hypothetical protein
MSRPLRISGLTTASISNFSAKTNESVSLRVVSRTLMRLLKSFAGVSHKTLKLRPLEKRPFRSWAGCSICLCGGDPLTYRDPSGHFLVEAFIGAGIGAAWGGLSGWINNESADQIRQDMLWGAGTGFLVGLTDGDEVKGVMRDQPDVASNRTVITEQSPVR